ncbi:MAG: glutamine-synthetase adenylyltransferase [Bdellovibrio sp.]
MSDLGKTLRQRRAREWAECARLTFEREVSTQEICLRWSRFADASLTEAFKNCSQQIPLQTQLGLFAYGKLGSNELNLSSDVDLVLVSDSDDPNLKHWLRRFRQLLQDPTEDGFCFRLDFDLRPGGRMGSIIPTLSQFEDYFSNYGEAWERLAFVRFRPVCGDEALLKTCMAQAHKFTFRKHLDFGLMEDLKDLRQRIHEQNWRRSENGAIDLKLGLGGIRDLELFVHTLQVIHGGRLGEFRTESTTEAIQRLKAAGLVAALDSTFLQSHYWELRHYENALQGSTDQQIQVLKQNEWPELISSEERELLRQNMQKCRDLVTSLLGAVDEKARSLPEADADQLLWLQSLGFSNHAVQDLWPSLAHKTVLSRQPERDELYRKRFLFEMVSRLAAAPAPDFSLRVLHDFLKSIRAKSSFFYLLVKNPQVMDRLGLLFSHSSYLSQILIGRPELLDSFLYQMQDSGFAEAWDDFLSDCLEKKLLAQLTSGLDFLKDRDLDSLLSKVTRTADTLVTQIFAKLQTEHATKLEVLCLGKWGGGELGLHSDLDLVFVCDSHPPDENDAKVARRLISRLTEVQRGGSLYQLDFRLKPHGKGGLLMTAKLDLLEYLKTHANIWERQAYLRTRSLAAHPDFDKLVHEACVSRPVLESEWQQLRDIREALQRKSKSAIDLKHQFGGLIDTEFAVQLTRLAHQQTPQSTSTRAELKELAQTDSRWGLVLANYDEIRVLEQTLRLVSSRSAAHITESSAELEMLAGALHLDAPVIAQRMRSLLEQNAALLALLDPRTMSG